MHQYDIFISYSRKDSEIARRILNAFTSIGKKCFIDVDSISGGEEVLKTISAAISESRVFLLIGSKNSYSSPVIEREVGFAVHKGIPMCLYRIDDVPLPEHLVFAFVAQNWFSYRRYSPDSLVEAILTKPTKSPWQMYVISAFYLFFSVGIMAFVYYSVTKGYLLGEKEDLCLLLLSCMNLCSLHLTLRRFRLAYLAFMAITSIVLPVFISPYFTPRITPVIISIVSVFFPILILGISHNMGKSFYSSLDNKGLRISNVILIFFTYLIAGGALYWGSSYLPQILYNDFSDKQVQRNYTCNGVSFEMVLVEGLDSSSFYIGKTEVTQSLWKSVMKNNPSQFKASNHPVEMVSWDEINYEFLPKLNSIIKERGYRFDLPTEKEWIFAARGGVDSHGYTFSGSNTLEEVAIYKGNSHLAGPHDVQTKWANELGLYDMSGNVWEWCADTRTASVTKEKRTRGGSWFDTPDACDINQSESFWPSNSRYEDVGFRLILRKNPDREEYATVFYDRALDDYFDGRRRMAYYKLRVSAIAGYPPAQYLFGHMFFDALYPVHSPQPKRGIKWFKLAAESGNSDAQYDLGNAFFKGIGVEQDDCIAAQWYKTAAENGHAKAQNDYAFCLLRGIGVEKNESLAIDWLYKSAEQGCRDACLTLAYCFENGIGVQKNSRESEYWTKQVANCVDTFPLSR